MLIDTSELQKNSPDYQGGFWGSKNVKYSDR